MAIGSTTVPSQGGSIALALQPGKLVDGRLQSYRGRAVINLISNPNNNDSITIGAQTYTFVTNLASAGEVLIGANARASVQNLYDALCGTIDKRGSTFHANTAPLTSGRPSLSPNANAISLTAHATGSYINSVTLSTTAPAARITVSGYSGGYNGGDPENAFGVLSFTDNPADGNTVTIGTITYKFEATLSTAANDVRRGTNLETTIAALVRTINGQGSVGSDYSAGTASPHPSVSAEQIGSIVVLRAKVAGSAANSTALGATGTALSVNGSTLSGGRDTVPYDRTQLVYRRFRARDITYGVQQQQGPMPLEVGGSLTPTGFYKSLVTAAGTATFMPRFENALGELLLAATGTCVTTNNTTHGVHVFRFSQDEAYMPWLAVRKSIPRRGNVEGQGILAFNNLVESLTFNLQPAAPVEAQLNLFGLNPELDDLSNLWDDGAYEDFESIPITCRGSFRLPTVFQEGLPVTMVALTLSNQLNTDPIIGSYYVPDAVAITRQADIRFVAKWTNREMYQRAFGGVGETQWSPRPFITETVGSNYAFVLTMEAPFNIPGTNIPYSLSIRANSCAWAPQNDIRLQAGGVVMQEWMGTILYNPTSYLEFVLVNGRTTPYNTP